MIDCSTFQKQEPVIKSFTDKINAVKNAAEKAKFAEELQKEVGVLLECVHYDSRSLDCKNCRTIANMRTRTAGLIINYPAASRKIKAKRLEK